MHAKNNLNSLRLIAAGMVLYGHSYVFLGLREPLFLSWTPIGPLGVFIFFTISGYLVSESWDKDPSLIRFLARRGLRIFPGLIFCLLLTVLVLGPMFTTLSVREYFSNPHTLGYMHNAFLHIVYYLPGVFEGNRVANAVNGSLWSLPIEFSMYLILSMLAMIGNSRWVYLAVAIASALVCLIWAQVSKEMLVVYNFDVRQLFICGTYFWVGVCFYKFKLKRYLTVSNCLLALFAMLCLEAWTLYLAAASWVLLPVVVLGFGFSLNNILYRLTSVGDYSYGLYIYAFPIQQAVVYIYPNMRVGFYIFICTVLSLGMAILSWHLIEKRMLSLKPKRVT